MEEAKGRAGNWPLQSIANSDHISLSDADARGMNTTWTSPAARVMSSSMWPISLEMEDLSI
jgi:hypothetical protein